MTPGILEAPIYKGARYAHTLTFSSEAGGPLDLTGLSPFVCTVSHPREDRILATLTVVDTNLAGGILDISLSAAETDLLPLGLVRLGLRDANNNPYIASSVHVLFFSPAPV